MDNSRALAGEPGAGPIRRVGWHRTPSRPRRARRGRVSELPRGEPWLSGRVRRAGAGSKERGAVAIARRVAGRHSAPDRHRDRERSRRPAQGPVPRSSSCCGLRLVRVPSPRCRRSAARCGTRENRGSRRSSMNSPVGEEVGCDREPSSPLSRLPTPTTQRGRELQGVVAHTRQGPAQARTQLPGLWKARHRGRPHTESSLRIPNQALLGSGCGCSSKVRVQEEDGFLEMSPAHACFGELGRGSVHLFDDRKILKRRPS